MKRIFTDWLLVVFYRFPPLTKVFWKGEFEGKNLFFKKGRRGAAPNPRCRGAKAHTQSALPREIYYNRSRWSLLFLHLTKVFWKGEFEGKNLFFKKGFPLI